MLTLVNSIFAPGGAHGKNAGRPDVIRALPAPGSAETVRTSRQTWLTGGDRSSAARREPPAAEILMGPWPLARLCGTLGLERRYAP
jgi:hypothetical protein